MLAIRTKTDIHTRFQNALNVLTPNLERIVIALSGGSDSLALLHLTHQCFPKANITALTIDHQLRDNSAEEAKMVSTWVKALNTPHHTLRWEHCKLTGNLQAEARNARYQLMTDWCHANEFQILLLGHTEDDQAETIAYQQSRNAGPIGLSGMSAKRIENNIQLLRPLLSHSRKELQDWLGERHIEWVSDPSNENTEFARIRIRKALHADPKQKAELLALGQKMATERLEIEQAHTAFIDQHITANESHLHCPLAAFLKLERDQAAYTLGHILRHIGNDEYPPRYAKRLHALDKINSEVNQIFTLGHCFIKIKDEQLSFAPEQNSAASRVKPLVPSPFVPIFNSGL